MKFLRFAPANFTAVGPYDAEFQAEAREYRRVSIVHDGICAFESRLIDVE